jgi:serpin B
MKKRIGVSRVSVVLVVLAAVIAVSGLAGCAGPASVETIVKADSGWSDKSSLPAGSTATDAVASLVAGNTEFSLDLYSAVFEGDENLVLSPHSLSRGLAMTYAGARGETERQMALVLHLGLPQPQLPAAFSALDQILAGGGQDESPPLQLRFVQALWGQEGGILLEPFLDTLAESYDAGMQLVDFRRAEEARRRINEWASQQTDDRIEELLPPGALDSATALVLTNSAIFQAPWQQPFPEDATRDAAFTLLDGDQVLVPMMELVANLGFAALPGVQAVELPYAGGELSMVVLLPEEGALEAFADSLDGAHDPAPDTAQVPV